MAIIDIQLCFRQHNTVNLVLVRTVKIIIFIGLIENIFLKKKTALQQLTYCIKYFTAWAVVRHIIVTLLKQNLLRSFSLFEFLKISNAYQTLMLNVAQRFGVKNIKI